MAAACRKLVNHGDRVAHAKRFCCPPRRTRDQSRGLRGHCLPARVNYRSPCHHVVGGFYRVHTDRGPNENLNAPGMHFEPLAFAEVCNTPDSNKDPDAGINRFYAYGVIARLALLAAAREIAEHD